MSRNISRCTNVRNSGSRESYAHKAAKEIVAGWLRGYAAKADEGGFLPGYDPLGSYWRVNRDGPHFGVWLEYPILHDGCGVLPVWDEELDGFDDRPPTYKELVKLGRPPAAILDIAVQHKGQITYGVEIVHKHPVSDEKLDFLCDLPEPINLVVLPARWVLGQIGVPRKPPPQEFWKIGLPWAYRTPAVG